MDAPVWPARLSVISPSLTIRSPFAAMTAAYCWSKPNCHMFDLVFAGFHQLLGDTRKEDRPLGITFGYRGEWLVRGHCLNRVWAASKVQWPMIPLGPITLKQFASLGPDSNEHMGRILRWAKTQKHITTPKQLLKFVGLDKGSSPTLTLPATPQIMQP